MPKRRIIDGHLIRQCNGRHTNNSSVRKLKNNIGVGKGNGNHGMAFLHHLTCTCQLTSNAVSPTNSPSNFHFGFQSSPLCLCFRHRRRFTDTSISVRFSPRPSPGSRSSDGSHRRTTAKYKFMPIKTPRFTLGEKQWSTYTHQLIRMYSMLLTFNPISVSMSSYNLSAYQMKYMWSFRTLIHRFGSSRKHSLWR